MEVGNDVKELLGRSIDVGGIAGGGHCLSSVEFGVMKVLEVLLCGKESSLLLISMLEAIGELLCGME